MSIPEYARDAFVAVAIGDTPDSPMHRLIIGIGATRAAAGVMAMKRSALGLKCDVVPCSPELARHVRRDWTPRFKLSAGLRGERQLGREGDGWQIRDGIAILL
jgi:hypothetical protein